MFQLIQNQINNETVQTVDARQLHAFLLNGEHFATWIQSRITQYGFAANSDYVTFSVNTEKGRPRVEYAVTINTAKELAMVERNGKGREARRYFIECERRLREQEKALTHNVMLDSVKAAVESLNLCGAAKLLTWQKTFTRLNVPTDLLPSYGIVTTPGADVQSSKPAHALTHLLEQHSLPITSIAVNKLLEAAGYLETKARIGSKGQEKRYKSVTQKGLRYGYNMTSPQQQRQTQPYWFDDTFTELMADVGVYPA